MAYAEDEEVSRSLKINYPGMDEQKLS